MQQAAFSRVHSRHCQRSWPAVSAHSFQAHQLYHKVRRKRQQPVHQESTNGAAVAEAEPSAPQPDSSHLPEALSGNLQKCLCTLLVQCPDQKGVIAALAQLLYGLGCNIIESDQFTDNDAGLYFQRIRCDFSEIVVGTANTAILESAIGELAKRFDMDWKIFYDRKPKRVAVLVSKMDHCLYDLLIRHQRGCEKAQVVPRGNAGRENEDTKHLRAAANSLPGAGELCCELPIVISNHLDMRGVAEDFGIPFRHLPIEGKGPTAKREQEAQIESAIQELGIDILVLARYMQIFSPDFCSRHAMHTINIHHSFLPAFEGAKPYHRAYERGVKLLGATSHYATRELDAGPIIDQDVVRISHRDSVQDLIRKGRDLERLVLARAVRWVLEDRVLVHGNKTVVFAD